MHHSPPGVPRGPSRPAFVPMSHDMPAPAQHGNRVGSALSGRDVGRNGLPSLVRPFALADRNLHEGAPSFLSGRLIAMPSVPW